jgi:putative FmdB family regulatory protein
MVLTGELPVKSLYISPRIGNPGMPLFDFTCLDCNCLFEFLILKNSELPICPECGSRSVARQSVSLFSCTATQLTKRLKSESEENMKRGMNQMRAEKLKKDRIKII